MPSAVLSLTGAGLPLREDVYFFCSAPPGICSASFHRPFSFPIDFSKFAYLTISKPIGAAPGAELAFFGENTGATTVPSVSFPFAASDLRGEAASDDNASHGQPAEPSAERSPLADSPHLDNKATRPALAVPDPRRSVPFLFSCAVVLALILATSKLPVTASNCVGAALPPVSCVHAGSAWRANGRKAASLLQRGGEGPALLLLLLTTLSRAPTILGVWLLLAACCSYAVARRSSRRVWLLLTAAELPGASAQAVQVTSPCSLTDGGSCATSPNYPNSYGDKEECTISGVPPVELETIAFDVEAHSSCSWDYLTVKGTKYCGTSGPSGAVAEDGVITWRSDSVGVKSGWKAPLVPLAPLLTPL